MKHLVLLMAILSCLNVYAERIKFNLSHKTLNVAAFERVIDGKAAKIQFTLSYADISKAVNAKGIGQMYQLTHKNLPLTAEVGGPERLFHSEIFIGHPQEFDISLSTGKGYFFKKTLAPAKEMPCRCEKKEDLKKSFVINKESYRKSKQDFFKVEFLGDFRGIPLTRVSFYPVKTWGMNGFEVFPEIKFSLSSSKMIKPVDNFSELFSINSNKRYVIISPSKYKGALMPLIQRRQAQGFLVQFYDLEKIGSTFEEVKTFTHALYAKESFNYALLVGSEENFPTEYVATSSDSQTPSDLKYFTMGGEGDDIPDVFYGRLVVSNTGHVVNQVKKIIQFENRSFANTKGLATIIGIASNEGYDPTDVEYMKNMQRPLINELSKKQVEFFQDNSNSTAENINQAFSEGSFWVNYIGHGSGTSWPSIYRKEYHSDYIKKISAGGVTPVIIDVACQNGRFNMEKRLGERFMNETDAQGHPIGAVAYYGGSVDISWHPPAKMAVAINENMVEEHNPYLGQIIMSGQLELYNTYSDRKAAKENLVWYHLLGDPALNINLNH